MGRHRSLHPAALVAMFAIGAAGPGLAACSQHEGGGRGETAERPPMVDLRPASAGDTGSERAAGPRVRMELTAGALLGRSAQAELAAAARRFAVTLVGWLYGDRREINVEPIALLLRRELANAAPYVPRDQIGSGDGQAMRVQVFIQTSRSGVLVVTIRDRRTSYPIPASFERRVGRWRVVHLNTH
jgi:hypothetical protein